MPTTTDRCTCPTASAVCDGPQADCSVHGDVDSILASAQYIDRRGRRWLYDPDFDIWVVSVQTYEYVTSIEGIVDHDQMRLLIERDRHRSECPGLYECYDHPVPMAIKGRTLFGWMTWPYTGIYDTLAEAFAAAEQLATGENQ